MSKTSKIKVLFIISEMTWRGGENQARLLAEESQSDIKSFFIFPKGSAADNRLSEKFPHFYHSFKRLDFLKNLSSLTDWIQTADIQVIDCQSSKAHNLGLIIKRKLPHLRLVIHRRVDYLPSKHFFGRLKYLSPRIDAYVGISQAIAEILKSYGVPADKVHMVRSAVDSRPLKKLDEKQCKQLVRQELGLHQDRPIILNVAYHTTQKGIPTLIAALGLLKSRQIKFHCLLAGAGPLSESAKSQAIDLGLDADDVKFLGIRDDVFNLLLAADIFFLPSNFEGLGTSILDAMHAGLPIVASAVGGIPEIVHQDENGMLSAPGDAVAHSEALEKLCENPDLRSRLGKHSLKLASSQFSLEAMVQGNVEVFRSLYQKNKHF